MDTAQQNEATVMHGTYKMSWTAYALPAIAFLFVFLIGAGTLHSNIQLGLIIMLLALGWFTYKVQYIRSVVLYTDDHGVWVARGVLPWAKGVNGVKWRDLEDAVYFQNFFSWILKSYTIRVGHRFTKTSEIILVHMDRGHEAVSHINELQREMIAMDRMERTA